MNDDTAPYTAMITARTGRDAGKTFQVNEVPPVEMATFMLRLLAAIRLAGVDELLDLFTSPDGADMAGVMRLLAGCDPEAVRALINDALRYVQIAPDPQHPGMFRTLGDNDIREMATLGEVLQGFVKLNVTAS